MDTADLIRECVENSSVFGAFAKLILPDMAHLMLHRLDHARERAADLVADPNDMVAVLAAPFAPRVLLARDVEDHMVPVRKAPTPEWRHVP